jgi:C4-dicarboxylate-binding protein DctP
VISRARTSWPKSKLIQFILKTNAYLILQSALLRWRNIAFDEGVVHPGGMDRFQFLGRKPMKFLMNAASIAALTLSAGAAMADGHEGCDDGEIVVKFSHVTNTDRHPKGIAATLLQERVNAEMNGVMCMEVFPQSSLYNDDQVLEAMLQGDVQLAAPSLSKFEAFTRQFRIFDLPFMFTNIEAVDAFQASETGQAMLDSMQRRGLQGLGYWHNGMKQMSANVPLALPTDAAGLKFRVQASDVLVAQMEAMGASPQPMAFSEVYGALQTGVVDGQENTWSNVWGQKFFEVQDGVTETNHGIIDYLVVTSVDFLDSLEPEVRDQFTTILNEVTTARNAEAFAVNEAAKQSILDAGGTILTLTPEQRTAWVETMMPVWAQFVEDVGQENIDAAQAINDSL